MSADGDRVGAPALDGKARLTRRIFVLVAAGALLGAMTSGDATLATERGDHGPGPRFIVTLAPGVAEEAHETAERTPSETLDGRVLVIVTRDSSTEPRLQGAGLDQNAPPFWGINVNDLSSEGSVELSAGGTGVSGFPLRSLNDLPEGEYFVQALMNVYETFRRSDGTTVKLHMPCGDGHRVIWGTGNVYSDVQKVRITGASKPVRLELSRVIPPLDPTPPGGTCQQANPPESEHVKFVKIKSELLSAFWGRPMYVAASVLLPKGYGEDPQVAYPVIWAMNHHPRAYSFTGQSPGFSLVFGNFKEAGTDPFSQFWLADGTPRVIIVRPLSENPFYDTSYWVNSPNAGPYGDALTDELLPEIDRLFRTVGQPWSRTLTGCSSGGWIAAAAQVFYPDLFGGAFVFAPDVVDFRSWWTTNVYEDTNAYSNLTEWREWPRPYIRDNFDLTGNTAATAEDWGHLELAMGDKSRSGEYFHQLQATWGPQAPDGYPLPAWDPLTGEIDPAAAEQYRKYDISAYLAANWATLEPKLRGGRLQFWVTNEDTYFLNLAVRSLQEKLTTLSPSSDAQFNYSRGVHCQIPARMPARLVQNMADFMAARAPTGADITSWR